MYIFPKQFFCNQKNYLGNMPFFSFRYSLINQIFILSASPLSWLPFAELSEKS